MHRALLLLDILPEIFVHLLDSGSSSAESSRISLTALARTCKTFYEPAMDLLWANTGSRGISPLLGCVTRLRLLMCREDGESVRTISHTVHLSLFTELLSAARNLLFPRYRAIIRVRGPSIFASCLPRTLIADINRRTFSSSHNSPSRDMCVPETAEASLGSAYEFRALSPLPIPFAV
jgi:hypothetical protein